MHIAIYHEAIIPPQKYGGTERIVDWLAKALISLGHRVTLIAKPGSFVSGAEFIPYDRQKTQNWEDLVPKSVDILHLWSTPHPAPKKPFLVTIEGNGQPGEKFHSNTVFVSKKHAENHGSQYFVYNGIDPQDFEWSETRDDYLVFLAKASWKVKNLQGAIEIARKSKLDLLVMGSRDWPLDLHKWLSPKWRGVRYLGMVGDQEKRKLLKKARGLLFPVRWHEPFGIALTEALACGCPVFGTPYGSLPEIITPDVGALSTHADPLMNALLEKKFLPEVCRQRVFQGFTHIQMAEHYLRYYQEILKNGRLKQDEKNLQLQSKLPADTLLPWNE
jgi:glycosyltransferase involved in cell wall biosynthesis